jgi:hypothetical protein
MEATFTILLLVSAVGVYRPRVVWEAMREDYIPSLWNIVRLLLEILGKQAGDEERYTYGRQPADR